MPNNFMIGEVYTVSFYSLYPYTISAQVSDVNSASVILSFGNLSYTLVSGNVYRYTGTATVTGTTSAPRLLLIIPPGTTDKYFARFQLEKGTMATDWSPSPSDPASSVQVDAIYPVGAIYMSNVSTSPSTLFGGTWSAISNPPTGASYWWERTA